MFLLNCPLQELDPRAEEEATLSSYNDALRNYGADEFEAAERLFHDVLDSKFLAYCRHYGATATGLDKEKTGTIWGVRSFARF